MYQKLKEMNSISCAGCKIEMPSVSDFMSLGAYGSLHIIAQAAPLPGADPEGPFF